MRSLWSNFCRFLFLLLLFSDRKRNNKQWEKVQFLAEHGFYFQKVHLKEGSVWKRQSYPENLKQAKFVVQFKDQALNLQDLEKR